MRIDVRASRLRSRGPFVVSALAIDAEDREVARGNGTFVRSRPGLDEIEVYRAALAGRDTHSE